MQLPFGPLFLLPLHLLMACSLLQLLPALLLLLAQVLQKAEASWPQRQLL
jgi:hypothetical protein